MLGELFYDLHLNPWVLRGYITPKGVKSLKLAARFNHIL